MFSLVDSFFVPISRDVDPGRASEGILFLILGFRAVSRSELPLSVLVAGGCLSALVAALNHRLIVSPSLVWTPVAIVLLVFVMFWGLRKRSESRS
jgi:multisubunit Na+/H+ antiporter MnhE subunit